MNVREGKTKKQKDKKKRKGREMRAGKVVRGKTKSMKGMEMM